MQSQRGVGVDQYYSEVLPEDKAGFIEKEKAAGRKVIMIGDGINDSPALSASDVGIAISDGAEIAREIADVTVGAEDLYQVVMLRRLSELPDETHPLELPVYRRIQFRFDRTWRDRCFDADDLRNAAQYIYTGHQFEEHAESAVKIFPAAVWCRRKM